MTTEEEIKIISQIAAGLLASGEFTILEPVSDNGERTLRTSDNGEDWKKEGHFRRYDLEAVICAEWVFRQIKENAIDRAP